MPGGRWCEEEIRCALLWRLARNHGWANWIQEDDLIRAVPSHERGKARDIADDLRSEPYIEHHPNRGFKIENKHIDVLARELRDECDFSEFRIEATLSHFGGFE